MQCLPSHLLPPHSFLLLQTVPLLFMESTLFTPHSYFPTALDTFFAFFIAVTLEYLTLLFLHYPIINYSIIFFADVCLFISALFSFYLGEYSFSHIFNILSPIPASISSLFSLFIQLFPSAAFPLSLLSLIFLLLLILSYFTCWVLLLFFPSTLHSLLSRICNKLNLPRIKHSIDLSFQFRPPLSVKVSPSDS